ncbi:YidB family protein [Polaromonas hydrogenivorans]|uniref:YidB family protein n=1 Tax=Polaromonas hydrogenivorans TaxID=335476 RepID=A0AAU7LLE6_9BURK
MANDFLGNILGSVLGNAQSGQQSPMGGGLGGGLGDLLGGMLGGNRGSAGPAGGGLGGLGGLGGGSSGLGNKGSALMLLLLPLAMQWVQRNGGIGAVLERFRNKGYSQQAASWVSTGPNEALAPQAVNDVIGMDELSRLSQQLGVSQEEVSSGMAQILPEMVNQLTPQGGVPDDGDNLLNRGMSMLEQFMNAGKPR